MEDEQYLKLTKAEFNKEDFQELVKSYRELTEFKEGALKAKGILVGEITHWTYETNSLGYEHRVPQPSEHFYFYKGEDEILADLARLSRKAGESDQHQREAIAANTELDKVKSKLWLKWIWLLVGILGGSMGCLMLSAPIS